MMTEQAYVLVWSCIANQNSRELAWNNLRAGRCRGGIYAEHDSYAMVPLRLTSCKWGGLDLLPLLIEVPC